MATATYDVGQYDVDTYGVADDLTPTPIEDDSLVAPLLDLEVSAAVLIPVGITEGDDMHAPALDPAPTFFPVPIDEVGDVTQVGLELVAADLSLVPDSITGDDDVWDTPLLEPGDIMFPVPIEQDGDITQAGLVLLPLPLPPDTTYVTITFTSRVIKDPVTYSPRLTAGGTP